MKKLFTVLIIFINLIVFAGENLIVIHVKGTVKNNSNTLKPGDNISSDSKIVFENKDASAIVMSTKRGRLILSPKTETSSSELAYVVDNIIHPGTKQLSTRAGEILNPLDLKNYFSKDHFLILDSLELSLNIANMPIDQGHFFFVTYEYRGETINKKLGSTNGKLVIKEELLNTIDGKKIFFETSTNHQLYYYDTTEKKKSLIGQVNFTFPDKDNLQKETSILITFLKENGVEKKSIKNELLLYLNDAYGFVDKNNFETWLENRI